jgi:hypothetical protein
MRSVAEGTLVGPPDEDGSEGASIGLLSSKGAEGVRVRDEGDSWIEGSSTERSTEMNERSPT